VNAIAGPWALCTSLWHVEKARAVHYRFRVNGALAARMLLRRGERRIPFQASDFAYRRDEPDQRLIDPPAGRRA